MNLISEDYLMHYGVKGMKWGVRHDPRVQAAYKKRKDAKFDYVAQTNAGTSFKEYNNSRRKYLDANREYRDTKRLVKNEKKVSKYSNKAQSEADWARNTAKDINKNGDWEDQEFFKTLSPAQQKSEWARSKKVATAYMKDAKYWDKAVKDISSTKNKKEAKNLYKKYRNNAPYYGFGI